MTKLMLEIHEVTCIDETGGKFQEKVGGDEIALAGVQIDAEGRATAANRIRVGDFKKDGQVVRLTPPKLFASFDLRKGSSFPRVYQAVLILAELDQQGGLNDHVNKVVKELQAVPVPAAMGGGLGALAAAAAVELGKLAVKEAADAIKGSLKDDPFPPVLERLDVPSENFEFAKGSLKGPLIKKTVRAHDGVYQMIYGWRLA